MVISLPLNWNFVENPLHVELNRLIVIHLPTVLKITVTKKAAWIAATSIYYNIYRYYCHLVAPLQTP